MPEVPFACEVTPVGVVLKLRASRADDEGVNSHAALPIVCTTIDRLDALEPHATAWNALAGSLPQCLPMLTHAWVVTYFERTSIPEGDWVVVLAHRGDTLVGVLPGAIEGGLLRVPCDYHADDGDVVLAPGDEAETLSALLGTLREREPGIRAVSLGAVRGNSPTNAALAEGLPGWASVREPGIEGSSFPITANVETWFQGLSKNLRGDLRRSANKMRKAGLEEPVVRFQAGDEARLERFSDLARLEASGWKGEAGSAIATNEGTEAKYRALSRRFAEHGMLEWHDLYLGDRLAAMHMCVRMGENLMLLRQGFEHELGKYGVGNLLLRAAIEREHERRTDGEMNLVTDYGWCRRWRTILSGYDHVVLSRRRPIPWLRWALPVRLRQLARRTPGVPRALEWARSRTGAGGSGATSR